jgi:hypothetical protein
LWVHRNPIGAPCVAPAAHTGLAWLGAQSAAFLTTLRTRPELVTTCMALPCIMAVSATAGSAPKAAPPAVTPRARSGAITTERLNMIGAFALSVR